MNYELKDVWRKQRKRSAEANDRPIYRPIASSWSLTEVCVNTLQAEMDLSMQQIDNGLVGNA
jgi:hypothetical protein